MKRCRILKKERTILQLSTFSFVFGFRQCTPLELNIDTKNGALEKGNSIETLQFWGIHPKFQGYMQSSNKLIGLCHGRSPPVPSAALMAEFKLMLSTGVACEANPPDNEDTQGGSVAISSANLGGSCQKK